MNIISTAPFSLIMLFKVATLVAAVLLYCGKLQRKSHFWPRLLLGISLSCVYALVVPELSSDAFIFGSILFFSHLLLTVLLLHACFEESWLTAIFVATAGHVMCELSNVVATIVSYIDTDLFQAMAAQRYGGTWVFLRAFIGIVLVYPLYYFICIRPMDKIYINRYAQKQVVALLGLTILLNIVIRMFNAVYVEINAPFLQNMIHQVTLLFTNGLVLFLLNGISRQSRAENELTVIHYLWEQAKSQYAMSKESIDAINRKCHDLKYQILSIQKDHSTADLSDIVADIDVYDRSVDTGSEVLDVILTEKSFHCSRKNILLQCIADGQWLTFMEPVDLYILFGNLFDNCIMAVDPLTEVNLRTIWLNIHQQQNFVLIQLENPYRGILSWKDGLPETTKGDTDNHGFGMLSIRTIVRKYHGEISIDTANNLFRLAILIPLPPKQAGA